MARVHPNLQCCTEKFFILTEKSLIKCIAASHLNNTQDNKAKQSLCATKDSSPSYIRNKVWISALVQPLGHELLSSAQHGDPIKPQEDLLWSTTPPKPHLLIFAHLYNFVGNCSLQIG